MDLVTKYIVINEFFFPFGVFVLCFIYKWFFVFVFFWGVGGVLFFEECAHVLIENRRTQKLYEKNGSKVTQNFEKVSWLKDIFLSSFVLSDMFYYN